MEHLNFNEVLWVQHSKGNSDKIVYKLCGQNNKIQTRKFKSIEEADAEFGQLLCECENSGVTVNQFQCEQPKAFIIVLASELVNLRQVESVEILTYAKGCGVLVTPFTAFKFKFKDGSQYTTQRQVVRIADIDKFSLLMFGDYGIIPKWNTDLFADESKNKTNEGEKTMEKKEKKEEKKPWFERVDASQVASVYLGKNSRTIVVKYCDYDNGQNVGREIHFPFKTCTEAVDAFESMRRCQNKQLKNKVRCISSLSDMSDTICKGIQFISTYAGVGEDSAYIVNLDHVKEIQIENKMYEYVDGVETKLLHFKFKNEHIPDATIEFRWTRISSFLSYVREAYPDIVITERFTREPKPEKVRVNPFQAGVQRSIECFDADGDPFEPNSGFVNLDMDAVGSVALCGALGLTGLVLLGVLA